MKDRLMLDGDWRLTYVENKRLRTEKPDISTEEKLAETGYPDIYAKVPGGIERDFFRAGLIEDPYKYTNVLETRKLEKYHMFYHRTFELGSLPKGETVLHFDGIDTAADIYLNGKKLGETENMLISHEFDVSGVLRAGKNEIIVHIKPATIYSRKYPLDAGTSVGGNHAADISMRKAPHMYGWDILPRMVGGGIWKSVWIEEKRDSRIDDIFGFAVKTDAEKKTAAVRFYVNMTLGEDEESEYSLEIKCRCGGSEFTVSDPSLWHNGIILNTYVENAKLWMPRNYGEPNLYDVTAKLFYRGEEVDEYRTRIGLRTARLIRTDTTDKNGDGEFVFVINGKKIFAYGTNWVPVDASHSFDERRLPEILPMLSDLGCNIVRCWGGNVYENDIFYNYCDENGILVWQDFIMGCALYPQDERFKKMIFDEACSVVKRLRNHVCITLWAGDNECDEALFWGGERLPAMLPSANALTRKVIPSALRLHDQTRPYLPSSPYMSDELVEKGLRYAASENHLWGPRDYFKGEFYGNSICHFASETGYHGCPSPDSLRKFISGDQLWHWERSGKKLAEGELWERDKDLAKPDWLVHAACTDGDGRDNCRYRIPLMANQVITLFGGEPYNIDDFAYMSQISQAEAKKYFIERFRATKWRRTGIIWWNLIDGWPQISDSVVDYYGVKKLAYHYIKRSQAPVCFIFDEPKDGQLPLVVTNDLQEDKKVRFKVTDLTNDEVLIDSTVTARADSVTKVWNKDMQDGEKRFYLIEWEYDGIKGKNHYFTNIRDIDYKYYVDCMKKAGFYDEFEGFGEKHKVKSKPLPYVFDKNR